MAKFYVCRHCGNLIGMIHDAGVPIICCGEKMEELVPNTVEASGEKHVPQVTVADGIVKVDVGSVAHPMLSLTAPAEILPMKFSLIWIMPPLPAVGNPSGATAT